MKRFLIIYCILFSFTYLRPSANKNAAATVADLSAQTDQKSSSEAKNAAESKKTHENIFRAHCKYIELSPHKAFLMTISHDGKLVIADAVTQAVLHRADDCNIQKITSADFSHDNQYFYYLNNNNQMVIQKIGSNDKPLVKNATSVIPSTNKQWVALSYNGQITVLSFESMKEKTVQGQEGVFSPDNSKYFFWDGKKLSGISLTNLEMILPYEHAADIKSIKANNNGRLIIINLNTLLLCVNNFQFIRQERSIDLNVNATHLLSRLREESIEQNPKITICAISDGRTMAFNEKAFLDITDDSNRMLYFEMPVSSGFVCEYSVNPKYNNHLGQADIAHYVNAGQTILLRNNTEVRLINARDKKELLKIDKVTSTRFNRDKTFMAVEQTIDKRPFVVVYDCKTGEEKFREEGAFYSFDGNTLKISRGYQLPGKEHLVEMTLKAF